MDATVQEQANLTATDCRLKNVAAGCRRKRLSLDFGKRNETLVEVVGLT